MKNPSMIWTLLGVVAGATVSAEVRKAAVSYVAVRPLGR